MENKIVNWSDEELQIIKDKKILLSNFSEYNNCIIYKESSGKIIESGYFPVNNSELYEIETYKKEYKDFNDFLKNR